MNYAPRILHHMKQLERGIDLTKMPVPPVACFLQPDRPFSGRLIPLEVGGYQDMSLTFEEAAQRSDVIWVPPSLSNASRRPAPRTKGSVRGHIYDPRTNREVVFESMHEYRFANLQFACREVLRVDDQPPPVRFKRPGDDAVYRHTFDFLVHYRSRKRIAFAVKPAEELDGLTLLEDVELMCQQSLEGFADEAYVVTDELITHDVADNADEIVNAVRCRNDRDCVEMLEQLQSCEGSVSLLAICDGFAVPGRARVAILNLIFDGLIVHLDPTQRFDDVPFIAVVRN